MKRGFKGSGRDGGKHAKTVDSNVAKTTMYPISAIFKIARIQTLKHAFDRFLDAIQQREGLFRRAATSLRLIVFVKIGRAHV